MRRGPMPRCTLRQVTVVAGPALLAPRAEPEVVRPRAKRSCRTARRGRSDRPPPARSFPAGSLKMDSSLLVLVIAFRSMRLLGVSIPLDPRRARKTLTLEGFPQEIHTKGVGNRREGSRLLADDRGGGFLEIEQIAQLNIKRFGNAE